MYQVESDLIEIVEGNVFELERNSGLGSVYWKFLEGINPIITVGGLSLMNFSHVLLSILGELSDSRDSCF